MRQPQFTFVRIIPQCFRCLIEGKPLCHIIQHMHHMFVTCLCHLQGRFRAFCGCTCIFRPGCEELLCVNLLQYKSQCECTKLNLTPIG